MQWQLLPRAVAEDPHKAHGLARKAATNCLWLEAALAPGNEHYFSTEAREIFYPLSFRRSRWDGDSTPVVYKRWYHRTPLGQAQRIHDEIEAELGNYQRFKFSEEERQKILTRKLNQRSEWANLWRNQKIEKMRQELARDNEQRRRTESKWLLTGPPEILSEPEDNYAGDASPLLSSSAPEEEAAEQCAWSSPSSETREANREWWM